MAPYENDLRFTCLRVFGPECLVTCSYCGKILEDPSKLHDHLDFAHEPKVWKEIEKYAETFPFQCILCPNSRFVTNLLLHEHIIRAHLKEARVQVKESRVYCHRCGKDFANLGLLLNHKDICENEEQPPIKRIKIEKQTENEIIYESSNLHQDDFELDSYDNESMSVDENSIVQIPILKGTEFSRLEFKQKIYDSTQAVVKDVKKEEQIDIEEFEIEKVEDLDIVKQLEGHQESQSLSNLNSMRNDEKVEDEKTTSCKFCPRKFTNESFLAYHLKTFHEDKVDVRYCQYCPRTTLGDQRTYAHMKGAHSEVLGLPENSVRICTLCRKLFKTKEERDEHHEKLHSIETELVKNWEEDTFDRETGEATCRKCNKKVKSQWALKNHYRNQHAHLLDMRVCPCCPRVLFDNKSMYRHMMWAHKSDLKTHKDIFCSKCKVMFKTKEGCESHKTRLKCEEMTKIKTDEREKVKETLVGNHDNSNIADLSKRYCKLCDKSYDDFTTVRKHVVRVHGKIATLYPCSKCVYKALNEEMAREHFERLHGADPASEMYDGNYCKICKKCFKSVKAHVKLKHLKIKQPVTKKLKKKEDCFSDNDTDEQNDSGEGQVKNVIKKEKKFKCDFCKKSFALECRLTSHLQYEHEDKVDVRYCPFCPRRTLGERRTYRHMKGFHSDRLKLSEFAERACPFCMRLFKSKEERKEHFQQLHNADTDIVKVKKDDIYDPETGGATCGLCKMKVSQRTYLTKHYLFHHPETLDIRECSLCPEILVDSQNLFWHMTFKHKSDMETHKERICFDCKFMFKTKEGCEAHKKCHANEDEKKTTTKTRVKSPKKNVVNEQIDLNFKDKDGKDVDKRLRNPLRPPQMGTSDNSNIVDHENLICKLCDKQFEKEKRFRLHVIKQHHKWARTYPCTKCNFVCLNEERLKRHEKVNHFEIDSGILEGNSCKICNKSYPLLRMARSHAKIHSKGYERPTFICELCGKLYRTKEAYEVHLQNGCQKPDKVYDCKECGSNFVKRRELNRHMLNVHPEEVVKFSCSHCLLEYWSKSQLDRHVASVHSDSEQEFCVRGKYCKICDKTFLSVIQAVRHGKTHYNDELPCEVCGKTFREKHRLTEHVRYVHQGERKIKKKTLIKCEHCDHQANTKYQLSLHIREDHPDVVIEEGPPAICDVCGKLCTNEDKMLKHRKAVHSENVQCSICGYETSPTQMPAHKRDRHRIGKKKFCHSCDFETLEEVELNNHLEEVHIITDKKLCSTYTKCRSCHKIVNDSFGEDHRLEFHKKIYSCEMCAKVFSDNGTRKRHINNIHLGIPKQEKKSEKKIVRKKI